MSLNCGCSSFCLAHVLWVWVWAWHELDSGKELMQEHVLGGNGYFGGASAAASGSVPMMYEVHLEANLFF